MKKSKITHLVYGLNNLKRNNMETMRFFIFSFLMFILLISICYYSDYRNKKWDAMNKKRWKQFKKKYKEKP